MAGRFSIRGEQVKLAAPPAGIGIRFGRAGVVVVNDYQASGGPRHERRNDDRGQQQRQQQQMQPVPQRVTSKSRPAPFPEVAAQDDRDEVADSLGKNLRSLRTSSLVIGGAIAGLSGGVLVGFINLWDPRRGATPRAPVPNHPDLILRSSG